MLFGSFSNQNEESEQCNKCYLNFKYLTHIGLARKISLNLNKTRKRSTGLCECDTGICECDTGLCIYDTALCVCDTGLCDGSTLKL